MRFVVSTAVVLTFSSRCHVFAESKHPDDSVEDSIPIIDIGHWTRLDESPSAATDRALIADAVGKACTEIGFFAVVGHAVNASTIHNAWQESAKFFDLPMEIKLASKTQNEKEYPYGYEHSERLQLGKRGGEAADALPDLKETFSFGPSNPAAGMPPRRFPAEPSSFREALEVYYSEMEKLALTLLRIFAVALDLPEDWFVNKMDHHMGALRILNYFPIVRTTVKPDAVRASAHTDYGALTILRSGGPGLQVKKDDETDAWIDVPSLSDAFIINIGDLMQRWTNDKWVSTLHRVILPSFKEESLVVRRQSIAFFCNINGDAVVEPMEICRSEMDGAERYLPVMAKDYLMTKHLASMAVDSSIHRSAYDEL